MRPSVTEPADLVDLLGIPFTGEQLDAITAPPEPAVIVAGAGSGKTTVMAARVVWLVGTGQVRPEQVLGLTFTNKAAGELTERVRTALARAGVTAGAPAATGPQPPGPDDGDADAAGEPEISTYHAFAGRLLTEHGLRIGVEPGARLLADATRFQLAARALRTAPGPYPALTSSFPTLVADLLALDGELSEHLVTPDALRAHDRDLHDRLAATDPAVRGNAWVRDVAPKTAARLELTDLVERYRAEKSARGVLDFGDQIALAARLATTPAGAPVRRALREQYAVVLLDEYQDTSVAQRLLLAGLFGGGCGHPVTAVGDPCQAIYGWRGASVANLDDFPLHFPRADGRPAARHALSENRRSGGRLLELANGLAAPLRARHAGVEALRPAPGAERDGTVRCALLPTHEDEIDWIADHVAHRVRTDATRPGGIAVLCRAGRDFPAIHAALTARGVPVEVVGLSGLLHLPEVADVVAVCEVLHDPTANDALVRLLVGPRWRIGPRDLALLGRRARELVRIERGGAEDAADPDARLAEAVAGTDPTEVVSLAEAVADPGDTLPFSAEARVRFARLAAELRDLRRSLGDPLLDVLHRVLAATGLDVELAASPQALAARRRETLGRFLDAAGTFMSTADLDGDPSLGAFLAFLRAAEQYDRGMDAALPGADDTVKVMTAHKAKGLEWDVVAVPGLVKDAFPSTRGRERWTTAPRVLPHPLRGDAETLPAVEEWSRDGMKRFGEDLRAHQSVEELRLGYVTFTRPRSLLLGSGHWWGPTQTRPRGASPFLQALREHCEAGGGEVEAWADAPEKGAANPLLEREDAADRPWPLPLDPEAARARRRAADAVRWYLDRERSGSADGDHGRAGRTSADGAGHPAADGDADAPDPGEPFDGEADPFGPGDPFDGEAGPPRGSADAGDDPTEAGDGPSRPAPSPPAPSPPVPPRPRTPAGTPPQPAPPPSAGEPPTPEEARTIASWDRDLTALTGELLRSRRLGRDVPLPAALSASQLLRLAADPDGFARDLARPMPRPPAPAARRGTEFHAWVESLFAPLPMITDDELPGLEEDSGIEDEHDLAVLKEAFLRTGYADRRPYRVEAPFQLRLGARLVRGRIDAVYRDGSGGYEVVDWKTGRTEHGDPLQLAVYRLAWAETAGVAPERVDAAFLYVRSGRVVRPAGLPGRAALTALLDGGPGPAAAPPAPGDADRPQPRG